VLPCRVMTGSGLEVSDRGCAWQLSMLQSRAKGPPLVVWGAGVLPVQALQGGLMRHVVWFLPCVVRGLGICAVLAVLALEPVRDFTGKR
jgi:hypothetical protein